MKKSKFEKLLLNQFTERLQNTHYEIEQKYRLKDPAAMRKMLQGLGAEKGRHGWEHNELYDIDRALREKKQVLRLRYHGSKFACLTFKGPREKGQHKRRMEIESHVEFDQMKRILLMLGYRMVSNYRKYREEYDLPNAKVCLDHLKNRGWFIEIEGTSKTIKEAAKKLGLESKDREERSYRRLLKEEAPVFA